MEQDKLDAQVLAEIQKLLATNTAPGTSRSSRFDELNEQLHNAAFNLPATVLEGRYNSSKPINQGGRILRVGYGLIPAGSQLEVIGLRVAIPIIPHLHWENALIAPSGPELVSGPFVATSSGLYVLDEPTSKSLNIKKNITTSRELRRVTVTLGDEATWFMREIADSLRIPFSSFEHFIR
jgi:hypothetical protein